MARWLVGSSAWFIFLSMLASIGPWALVSGQVPSTIPSVVVRQNGLSWEVRPLVGKESPWNFYAYREFRSHNPLVQTNGSLIFLYYYEADPAAGGGLYLVIIHGPSSRGIFDNATQFSFWGLPTTAAIELQDDPDDSYWISPPSANIHWQWRADLTDGVIIRGLSDEFSLALYPRFANETMRWLWVTGSLQDPEYIELPSLREPLLVQARLPDPQARFSYSPAWPRVGESIAFDASASRSRAGPIVQYRWDFDEDGAFEVSSASPWARQVFTAPGEHRVTLEVEDSLGRTAQAAVSIPVRADPVQVTRQLITFLPDLKALRGYSIRVELLIQVNTTVNGLGLKEIPPPGWSWRPLDHGGAQFNAETLEWLFLEILPAGTQRRIRYELSVPAQEQPGLYRFEGRALSGTPSATAAIGGDSQVQVVMAIPLELAISRLSDQGELDLTLPNVITFNQILMAAAFWQEQRPVPGTNGRRIDLSTMVRLVAYWLTDTPVDQPLP